MKYFSLLVSFLLSVFFCFGQSFSGVDELGRILPQQSEVGDKSDGKQIGLFYFLWQGHIESTISERVWDLTKLYEDNPSVFKDFNHTGWGGGAGVIGRYYFWGESIYGYYRGDDYWVQLKNIQLLTDAGVDFLIIDATNRVTYQDQAAVLMKAMDAVRKQGKNAPKIVFYTNTLSGGAMQEIYNNFYAPEVSALYSENWYCLDGKPLIIGISKEAKGSNYESFFTIRESQWPDEVQKENGWPWIEFQRPQKVYFNHKGEKEIVNVSAAQHPNLKSSMGGAAFYGEAGSWGRSFRNGRPGNSVEDIFYGYNIQEQWDFALKQDVPFIFITGWNEWIAGKWRRADPNQSQFVDQANAEFSRDIEPTLTGGLKDNYYMQMIANIRKYKGADTLMVINKQKPIDEIFNWQNVDAVYVDYVGDVDHRNHPGATTEPKIIYENKTGRNDIKDLKLVASEEHLHFYVQTVDKLSPKDGESWMTLLLNTDQSYSSGWYGYDYRVVNGDTLQRFINGFWEKVSEVDCEVYNNEMIIKIPYVNIGVPNQNAIIEFKWSDNMQKNDPLDWYVNGDVAPGGRLNVSVKIK